MNIALWIARLRGWFAGLSFERAARHPQRAQDRLLGEIIRENQRTAFGRDHDFESIETYDDYAAKVLIQDYEGHRPYVDRIAGGELNALTQEEPFMLGSTSGTTNQAKWIPITKTWQEKMASLLRLWIARASWSHPRMFSHQILTITSPAVEELTQTGMPVGSISGVTKRRAPWVVRKIYAVPYEVAAITSYELRYYMIIRFALQGKLSSVYTPNPSTLIQLAQVLRERASELIEGIASGTLGVNLKDYSGNDHQVLSELSLRLKPLPQRARWLQDRLEKHGALIPKVCWPNLSLIGCWLGGSAGVHAQKLAALYGETGLRDLGFRATEGTFTVPLEDDDASGVLALDSHFYEFIRVEDIEHLQAPVLRAHELDVGCEYYLFITTRAGLYRYDINDVIEVTGMYRRAPVIRFLRKGRDMVSIVGEKLHVNQLLAAARRAQAKAGLIWYQFQVLPDSELSCYHLLVEPADEQVSLADLNRFAQAFDAALMDENPEYPTKRRSNRLGPPRVVQMKAGWADRLRQKAVAAGKRDIQFKWPYICVHQFDDTDDEILRRI